MTSLHQATWAVAFLVVFVLAGAGAEAKKAVAEPLQKGDKAPVFRSTDDQGKAWKSTDHVGKKIVVIYFYPADLTGGCTRQACGFRDDMTKLADKGVEVIGVSGDSASNHRLFKKVHNLKFTLLADEDGSVAKMFGVPVHKGGEVKAKNVLTDKLITNDQGKPITLKRGVTIERWTFVIGKDGKILLGHKVASAAKDSKEILKLVEGETKQ
jgi:peroxiredoxin Q/BCP